MIDESVQSRASECVSGQRSTLPTSLYSTCSRSPSFFDSPLVAPPIQEPIHDRFWPELHNPMEVETRAAYRPISFLSVSALIFHVERSRCIDPSLTEESPFLGSENNKHKGRKRVCVALCSFLVFLFITLCFSWTRRKQQKAR